MICPLCNSNGALLGTLGRFSHYRCVDCGFQFSTKATKFLNRYNCSGCHFAWEDTWYCACNDRCPECNKEIEPYESEEVANG